MVLGRVIIPFEILFVRILIMLSGWTPARLVPVPGCPQGGEPVRHRPLLPVRRRDADGRLVGEPADPIPLESAPDGLLCMARRVEAS